MMQWKCSLAAEYCSKWRQDVQILGFFGDQGFPLLANVRPRRTVWLKNGKGTQKRQQEQVLSDAHGLGW